MGGRKEEKTMTIISTEMLKWKRNKTVLGIFILTAILGIFAVERAFSIEPYKFVSAYCVEYVCNHIVL